MSLLLAVAAGSSCPAQDRPPISGGEVQPAPGAPPGSDAQDIAARHVQRDLALLGASAQGGERVPFYWPIPDGIEPLNRGFHGFNNLLVFLIIDPLEKGYRLIFPEPVRRSIQKAGYNLNYLDRLINTLLQGKLKGAGVETERFLINTTVGLLGFFDPATHWGIKTYDEDFGQTFAHYGMGWGSYFEAPIIGSTSIRDGLGQILDGLTNPLSLISMDYVFTFNELSFTLPQLERLDAMSEDPYVSARDYWALDRQRKVKDYDQQSPKFELPAEREEPAPTLGAIFFQLKDPHFPERMREREALIPATGRKLPYSCRIQPRPAPLVFVVPGVGGHRLADASLALAEMAWKRGYSVATVSSPMNWEFIRYAGTHAAPGYTPDDAADLNAALGAVREDLLRKYPGRFTSTALIGFSLGGLEGLFIADLQSRNTGSGAFKLDQVVAVNPPVDTVYALHQVDEYYRAPLQWPEGERKARMENALLKAVNLARSKKVDPNAKLPFSATESHYLIGYVYRLFLRDIIRAVQVKNGTAKGGGASRQAALDSIVDQSYADYVRQFVLPQYLRGDRSEQAMTGLLGRSDMTAIGESLRRDPRVRVIVNRDDFLLGPGDLEWMQSVLGDRLTVFEHGGHLGNIRESEVQDRIMQPLDALKR